MANIWGNVYAYGIVVNILSSLLAPQAAIMTACSATSDDKASFKWNVGFQCITNYTHIFQGSYD